MPKPCLVSRCPEYAQPGGSYCARHARERWALGLTGGAGRNTAELARLRRIVFARQHGRCACGAPCTILHHKRSAYENSPEHLVGVCGRCHKLAHAPGSPRRLRP